MTKTSSCIGQARFLLSSEVTGFALPRLPLIAAADAKSGCVFGAAGSSEFTSVTSAFCFDGRTAHDRFDAQIVAADWRQRSRAVADARNWRNATAVLSDEIESITREIRLQIFYVYNASIPSI